MSQLPANLDDRLTLADELHARPTQIVQSPARVTQVAVAVEATERAAELEHLLSLCAQCSLAAPQPQAVFFSAQCNGVAVRWERHGEFSSYSFVTSGLGPEPFLEPPIQALPEGWLAGIAGRTLFAAHALVIRMGDAELDTEELRHFFGDNVPVGSEIGAGAGVAFSDYKVHEDGFSRFVLLDRHLTPRQCGRMLQRLFEIETYRMLALLSLPVARRLWPRISEMERALMVLTEDVAEPGTGDAALLERLTKFAAQVEYELSHSQGRFAASRAYRDLVETRIRELREERMAGIQPIGEFMARRFVPATQTIASAERRLRDLSERIGRVSTLLSARVEIAQETQTQKLLASLDRRAETQLRLQRVVESLSVAAIVYYGSGLVGHLMEAFAAAGLRVHPEIPVGVSIPIITGICIWALHRAHQRAADLDAATASDS
jgi:uncharacterized membrane-anchored protein